MSFTFNLKRSTKHDYTNVLEISGELRRGSTFDSGKLQQVIADAKSKIADTYLIFDLSDVTFWDTEGMLLIIQSVYDINRQKPKRAGFVEPKNEHLVKLADPINFAKRKLNDPSVGKEQIPFSRTLDDLVQTLQS
jgi:anti-anti-sigma regulatory factor